MARKIALFLGLFVAFLPYLGFPEDLDTILYTVAGLIIAFVAWSGKRPTPTSSIEEMEGELNDVTHDGSLHEHTVAASSPLPTPPPPQVEQVEEKKEITPIVNDKMVPVAFAKQRPRNLKKRITQDGSQPTP